MKIGRLFRVPPDLLKRWPKVICDGDPTMQTIIRHAAEETVHGDVKRGNVAVLVTPHRQARDFFLGNLKLMAGDYLQVIYRKRAEESELVLRMERILKRHGAIVEDFKLDDDGDE